MQIQKNANDLKRVMFTETSIPRNYRYCSQEPSNYSKQPNTGTQIGVVTKSSLNKNASINTQVQSLNTQQRKVFDVVCEWARKNAIYMNYNESQNPKPLNLFITGEAGVGKSHLIHTLIILLETNLHIRKNIFAR